MPRWLNLPSQLARPPQISRSECARPSWQNSIATNWPQQVNPRAWRSARVLLTSDWNSVRGKSLRIWLNMLENRFTVGPPLGGSVEGVAASTSPYRRGLIRFYGKAPPLGNLTWTRVTVHEPCIHGHTVPMETGFAG